ncbi:MAG: winged helix-turn-helix transcriptional regulator [Candidatus Freyarchaeota archaeon]
MVGESVIYAIDELQRQIRQEMEEPPTEILEPLVNTTNYLITTTLDEEGIIPLKELAQRLGIEQKTILYHVKQLKNHLLADYTRGYVYQLLRIIVQVLPEENNIIGRIRKAVKNIQRKLSKLTRTNTQTL